MRRQREDAGDAAALTQQGAAPIEDNPSAWFVTDPTTKECTPRHRWADVRAFLHEAYGEAFTAREWYLQPFFEQRSVKDLEHSLQLVREEALQKRMTDPSLPLMQRICGILKMRSDQPGTALLFEAKQGKVNHWCVSSGTRSKFLSRHVPVPYFVKLVALELEERVVTVVSGESGSGKTCAMLTCLGDRGFGVYMTPDDITEWKDDDFRGPLDAARKAQRNAQVRSVIKDAVQRLVGAELEQLIVGGGEALTAVVALDEAGSLPNLVRGLCASVDEIHGDLVGLYKHCSFRFVAGGTGADANASAPGSYPPKFTVVDMLPAGNAGAVARTIVAELKRQLEEPLGAALEDRADAREMCGNPRVAACILRQWNEVLKPHVKVASVRAAVPVVSMLLLAAAQKFKSLNGMLAASTSDVEQLYADALSLVFARDPKLALTDRHMRLIRNYGVLTDGARWVNRGDMPTGHVELGSERGLVLSSPPDRFRMSAAQSILFRMNYGYTALRDESWLVYETTVAQYLEAALVGCRGRSVSHLLTFLVGEKRIEQLRNECDEATRGALDAPLSVTQVVPMVSWAKHAPQPVDANSTAEHLADVKAQLGPGSAVVLVNAPESSFADVIVLVEGTLLLLVQCKFYAPSTPLSEATLDKEVAKMEQDAVLKDVAGMADGKGLAVRVLACTNPPPANFGSWGCSKGLMWWETSSGRGLAPLATHVPRAADKNARRTVVAVVRADDASSPNEEENSGY